VGACSAPPLEVQRFITLPDGFHPRVAIASHVCTWPPPKSYVAPFSSLETRRRVRFLPMGYFVVVCFDQGSLLPGAPAALDPAAAILTKAGKTSQNGRMFEAVTAPLVAGD